LQIEIDNISKTINDAAIAKQALKNSAYKAAKYGAGGTLASYLVGKVVD
jgi:hypothetical protein